jgi:septin family protein
LHDFIESTHETYYQEFKKCRLNPYDIVNDYEEEQWRQDAEIRLKQVKQAFSVQVKEKEIEFQQREQALNQTRLEMYKELTELQAKVDELRRDCEIRIGQRSLSG